MLCIDLIIAASDASAEAIPLALFASAGESQDGFRVFRFRASSTVPLTPALGEKNRAPETTCVTHRERPVQNRA